MKFLMYSHGGSGNHGCEAIIRSTVKLLGKDNTYFLFSGRCQEDYEYKINELCVIEEEKKKIKRKSIVYVKAFLEKYILKNNNSFDEAAFRKIFINSNKSTIALSIGGDNYCYGRNDHMLIINKKIKKKGALTVLWGCSVDIEGLDKEMIEDISNYDLIIARETMTYDSLKKLNKNCICLPDPAFQLNKISLELPNGFQSGNTIGINISPLILNYEKMDGTTFMNYENLIQSIIENTKMQIALISHVVWDFNDDRVPLKELYDKFKDTERIIFIEDHNCMELKGFISQCRFFIGARTHATIAAYSTNVPTLVVGYSIKAKGIAKDIFGTYENYVIPVQAMEKEDDLLNAFKWIMDREELIRKHLEEFMPGYCEKALEAENEIKKLMERN